MGFYEFEVTFVNMDSGEEFKKLIPVDFRGLSSSDLGTHNAGKAAWKSVIDLAYKQAGADVIVGNVEFISAS